MSTTTSAPAGPRPAAEHGSTNTVRGGPRRSVPHLLLGVLLVTSCTAGAVVWSLTIGERRPALALARPIELGQAIAPADLREVSVAVDGDVDAIPASETRTVIGQTAAATLPAGVLLPRGALGTTPLPADDRAVAALNLKAGQAPPAINTGASVLVVLAANPTVATNDTDTGSGTAEPVAVWRGVVVDATPKASDDSLVVSVELTENDARHVAAAPIGQLSVVLVSGGER